MERALARLTARGPLVVWGWFLLCAGVWTWPALLRPGAAALGSAHADGMKHLWTLWWMRSSVWMEGSFPLHTRLVNWPVGMDLYPIEPLHGLVAVVLPGLGLVALSNLLAVANLTVTGVAGAWFGRQVSGTLSGGLAAGTLLQGASITAFFVHVGVGELWHLWWLPLGLGWLVRARATLSGRAFAALGGCLVGATLSCFYLGFFLALATAVWALLTLDAGRQTGRLLRRYALTAALSLAVVVPVTRAFATTYRAGDVPEVGLWSYITGEHDQPVTDPPSARLDPTQLLAPGREAASREEGAYGGGRYLGWIFVGMALVGVARRPREGLPWLGVAAVGLVLAPGSALVWGGEAATWGDGEAVRLPMLWLNRALGYVAEPVNFPVRSLAVTVTALAALSALAARGAASLLAFAAVVEIAWGQLLGWPWETFSPADASALAVVADHRGHAVVDLSLQWRSDAENRWSALSAQIVHGHPIQAVPVERVETFAGDGVLVVGALPLVDDLEPLYNRQPGGLAGDYRADLALLRDAGFEELLVNYRGGRERMPDGLVDALTGLCGPPVARGAATAMWAIPDVEATEAELDAWQAAHTERVEALRAHVQALGPSW